MQHIFKYSNLPKTCPDCDSEIQTINALDTKAKCVIIICIKCKFVREYKKCPNCGDLVCL